MKDGVYNSLLPNPTVATQDLSSCQGLFCYPVITCELRLQKRNIFKEGDIGVCGIAVLDHFSRGISGNLITNCGIAVFSGLAGCGFFSILGGIKNYR